MCQKANTFQKRIEAFLSEHRLNDFRFVRRRKHPAVVITINGREIIHAFPGTASDHRAIENCICDLRHRLGLVAVKPKAANNNGLKRCKRRALVKRAIAPGKVPPILPVTDNYYAPLAALKARMAAAGVTADGDDGAPYSAA